MLQGVNETANATQCVEAAEPDHLNHNISLHQPVLTHCGKSQKSVCGLVVCIEFIFIKNKRISDGHARALMIFAALYCDIPKMAMTVMKDDAVRCDLTASD